MAARVPAIVRHDRQSIVVVDVAGCAGHAGMGIGQRKPGRAVIENCRRPTYCVMAHRTIRQAKLRTCRRVHGIFRLLPGGQMTAGRAASTCLNAQAVVAADMALLARHVGMAVGQRETDGRRSMVNRA